VTSQCPSGSGVPRAYHTKNAYAVAPTVSTLPPLEKNGRVKSWRQGARKRISDGHFFPCGFLSHHAQWTK